MKKLELKHLAAYLPYGLKVQFTPFKNQILDFENIKFVLVSEYCKPILRPLSDLTNQIDWKGQRFYPIERLLSADEDDLNEFYLTGNLNPHWESFMKITNSRHLIRGIDYWMIEGMFEWHFDVFGLIEKGLAIDINTLK